jgi:hypothetical protein
MASSKIEIPTWLLDKALTGRTLRPESPYSCMLQSCLPQAVATEEIEGEVLCP